jgi:hypothetical protein
MQIKRNCIRFCDVEGISRSGNSAGKIPVARPSFSPGIAGLPLADRPQDRLILRNEV